MTRPSRTALRLVAAVAALSLVGVAASCGDDGDDTSGSPDPVTDDAVSVSDVWARAATDLDATANSAIYMTIQGGGSDDELTAASVPSDITSTVELHETSSDTGDSDMGDMSGEDSGDMESGGDSGDMESGGDSGDMESGEDSGGAMMQMQEVSSIPVTAGETTMLEPGGYHIMLLDLERPLEPGETFDVTLTFAEAGELTVTAEVRES